MSGPAPEWLTQYAAALNDYLADGGEAALQRAYELGRRALADGLGVLEMAAIHHQAMISIAEPARGDLPQAIAVAGEFLAESLSPFEMTHRGYREAGQALRQLNERLEEEVRRIAHALHDEAGQLLGSVHLALDEFARDLPAPARGGLQPVQRLLNEIEEQLRHLSHELRPTVLDDLGLLPALEFLAERVAKRNKLTITVEGSTDARLPPAAAIALYRSVQEALANVVRHAQATEVRISVQQDHAGIRCTIVDDGIGFDVPTVLSRRGGHGLGLVGIRERVGALGGTLSIRSASREGTELRVTIPLET